MRSNGLNPPVHDPQPSPLTRRTLLQRGGVLVVGSAFAPLIAACGGDDTSGSAAAQGTPAGKPSGRIDFMSWQGYDAPDAMAPFKKRTGITLKATYMGNHDEIQTKILAAHGTKSLDMITYSQGYQPLYENLKILTPIDEDRLKNLGNLFDFFGGDYKNFWLTKDGTRIGVPFNWGYVAMSYDTAKIDQPATYDDLLDPKFKGKIGIPEDLIGVAQLAAHAVHVDITQMDDAAFGKVKDFLTAMVGQTKGVSPTYGDLATRFAEGGVEAAFCGWAPIDQLAADGGNKHVKTVLPDSGGVGYCDALAIPPTADNPDAVYAWIDETLVPETAAKILVSLGTATPVEPAVPLLPKPLQNAYPYDDIDAFIAKAPMYALPPFESDEFVTWPDVVEAWQEIKGA